jgi:hypothetical protein
MTLTAGPGLCPVCGEHHDELAPGYSFAAPDQWAAANEAEQREGEIDADSCLLVAGGKALYFLRGVIEVPVIGADLDIFTWSVWVSLDQESMVQVARKWRDRNRSRLAPMFCWLSNALPYDKPTMPLPGRVFLRSPGLPPSVELDSSVKHPLVTEQQTGITGHRVAELTRMLDG